MKPSLQFRLSQHLTLTPQLQQSIRLLQLSTVELNQEIDRILMDNPALEREDAEDNEAPAASAAGGSSTSVAAEAPAPEADWSPETMANWRGAEDDESEKSFTPPDTPTLRDHLHAQLMLTKLGPRDRGFVQLLIDALDEDGYLTQSLEEIAAMLPAEADAAPEELSIALRHLHNFEPAGVGARSPSECLCLQLRSLPDDPVRALALQVVGQHLETILRVSQAIVDRQRHFLEHGEVAMRPLVLREIAETLSLHESTISRVTTQKYMATPRGTFELKYFFGSHVATEAGGAASSTAIRALIKQLVAAEDAKAPLSDARIAQILGEQGIVVARRTIAKYRDALQIPAVNQRKAL